MQVTDKGTGRPMQSVISARSQSNFLADLFAVIYFRVGNSHIRVDAVVESSRLGRVLRLMLLSVPVRAGAGQVGKSEVNGGRDAIDVHRVGDRFWDIEP